MGSKAEISQSIADFFERSYVSERLPKPKQHDSRVAYRSAINALDRFAITSLGRKACLADLSDAFLSSAMAEVVQSGRASATANRLLRHIKSIWKFARDRRDLSLPRCQIKPMREERREPEAWFPAQLTQLVEAASRQPGQLGSVQACRFWKAVVLVQISTGIRIRTQLSLPTSHYDRDRCEILAPAELQKQSRDQRMELLPSASDAIEALAPWERGHDRLFADWPYDKDGRPDTLRRHLKRLLVEAGLYASVEEIPPYKHLFHKFRRSFATQVAASAGKDTAREMLGHSCQSVTDRYLDRRQLPRPRVADLVQDPIAPTNPEPPTLRLFTEPVDAALPG